MGGCCGTCRRSQLHGTPMYYYCPRALEEHELLTSHDSAAFARATGYPVDPNLDTSTLDTYRRPPTPLPFDAVMGHPQSTDSDFAGERVSGSSFEKTSRAICKKVDYRAPDDGALSSSTENESEFGKLNKANVSATEEEEDVCPTCFEDYGAENPKIMTKCNHHFHLSCIFEWLERSDTCPMCNQPMDFEVLQAMD